jgi:hypothetical protein
VPFVTDSWAILGGQSNEPFPVRDHAVDIAPAKLNDRQTSVYSSSNEVPRDITAKMVLGF